MAKATHSASVEDIATLFRSLLYPEYCKVLLRSFQWDSVGSLFETYWNS